MDFIDYDLDALNFGYSPEYDPEQIIYICYANKKTFWRLDRGYGSKSTVEIIMGESLNGLYELLALHKAKHQTVKLNSLEDGTCISFGTILKVRVGDLVNPTEENLNTTQAWKSHLEEKERKIAEEAEKTRQEWENNAKRTQERELAEYERLKQKFG